MSRVVILGAGISGHTAGAYARKWLGHLKMIQIIRGSRTSGGHRDVEGG